MTTFSTDDILSLDPELWSTAWLGMTNGKLGKIGSLGELARVSAWRKNRVDSDRLTCDQRRYVASSDAVMMQVDVDVDLLASLPEALRTAVGDDPLCECLASGYSPCEASRVLGRDSGNTWRKVQTIRKKLGRNDSESQVL